MKRHAVDHNAIAGLDLGDNCFERLLDLLLIVNLQAVGPLALDLDLRAGLGRDFETEGNTVG